MGDGRVNRAIAQGKAHTTEMKSRVPELRERVPELRERVPELPDGVKQRGSELRSKGAELRTAGQRARAPLHEIDVSWARCSYAKAARAGLLTLGLGPMIDFYVHNRVRGRRDLRHARPPGGVRGQPLESPRHAHDPARVAPQVAQPHGRDRRGGLLLQQALEGQRRRAPVQHRSRWAARAAAWAAELPITSIA